MRSRFLWHLHTSQEKAYLLGVQGWSLRPLMCWVDGLAWAGRYVDSLRVRQVEKKFNLLVHNHINSLLIILICFLKALGLNFKNLQHKWQICKNPNISCKKSKKCAKNFRKLHQIIPLKSYWPIEFNCAKHFQNF